MKKNQRKRRDPKPDRKPVIGEAKAPAIGWKAKAVIFDFDGTLTKPGSSRTTWEAIWDTLGYNASDCGLLAQRFLQREITHSKWCEITLDKFRAKQLSRDMVIRVGEDIQLLDDFDECMEEIQRLGIPAYIVSGSISDVIITALGGRAKYFKRIEANAFSYGPDGTLSTITGTQFDFKGKAEFITEVATELRVRASDILFVGNDINDIHVKSAGARTLLVNPRLTSPDPTVWNQYIPRMTSLLEILPIVDSSWEDRRAAAVLQESERAVNALKDLDELHLAGMSVYGGYRRFSNEDRASLVGLGDRIRQALVVKSQTRENFLVFAPPGSGKTFFVEEFARTLVNQITFVPIDLGRDDRKACEAKFAQVEASSRPCLCMIDEVDGRKSEEWPYEVIFKRLDLNEERARAAVVFVLIGSSGGTVKKLAEMIRSRHKGKDLIDRVLESAQHWAEIPPIGVGDTVCVYASKVLEAANATGKTVREIEKFAAYHAVLTCHTARQIKLLADQAVMRTPTGHTQVHYDNHFGSGDKTSKEFWQQHSEVAAAFGKQTFRISE